MSRFVLHVFFWAFLYILYSQCANHRRNTGIFVSKTKKGENMQFQWSYSDVASNERDKKAAKQVVRDNLPSRKLPIRFRRCRTPPVLISCREKCTSIETGENVVKGMWHTLQRIENTLRYCHCSIELGYLETTVVWNSFYEHLGNCANSSDPGGCSSQYQSEVQR